MCIVIIGRAPRNHSGNYNFKYYTVPQNYESVSRVHCQIEINDGAYYIKNIAATYGTFINRVRLRDGERRQIFKGDDIMLANQYHVDLNEIINICNSTGIEPPPSDYAKWSSRFVGYLLDSVFLSLASIPIFGIFFLFFKLAQDTHEASLLIIGWILYFLLTVLLIHFYYAVQLNKHGRTLGKHITKIRVVDAETKQNPSLGQAWGRYLAMFLSGLILYIGYLMPLWTEKKQALHDLLANTLVYKDNRL